MEAIGMLSGRGLGTGVSNSEVSRSPSSLVRSYQEDRFLARDRFVNRGDSGTQSTIDAGARMGAQAQRPAKAGGSFVRINSGFATENISRIIGATAVSGIFSGWQ